MRPSAWLVFVIVASAHLSVPAQAQTDDDSLRIYAVNVIKTPPLKPQFTGYGIYLGRGLVLTAAHVVGHWPTLTNPRVLIAGQELPATVVKQGSFEDTDLALLSIEEDRLSVSLRLRRNPICKSAPGVGAEVINVVPEKTTRSRIISPLLIAPPLRSRYRTLVATQEKSGSGLFDAERKCLLGIMSAKMPKYRFTKEDRHIVIHNDGFAGYFVPASTIVNFIPPDFRF